MTRSGEAYVRVPPLMRKRHIGCFSDEDEAAQAVDEQLREIVWHRA